MILKDIVAEYRFVYNTLLPCKPYFETADLIITDYFSSITNATSAYFKQTAITDGVKNNLINSLKGAVSQTYNSITVLITKSFEFHSAISLLNSRQYTNIELANLIQEFVASAKDTIEYTNVIIREQLSGMKTKELLSKFIPHLQKTNKLYSVLIHLYDQFHYVENALMEPVPEEIINNSDYQEFDIQSLSPAHDLNDVYSSLFELSNFFENIGRLCELDKKKYYYLRKVETGSLLTAFIASVPIIITTIKLIDFCYSKFINWNLLYCNLKEEQLKLSMDELQAAKTLLEIRPDLPNADELLETASVRLFKYFKLNPEFRVNKKTYKTNMDMKLLQSSKVETDSAE